MIRFEIRADKNNKPYIAVAGGNGETIAIGEARSQFEGCLATARNLIDEIRDGNFEIVDKTGANRKIETVYETTLVQCPHCDHTTKRVERRAGGWFNAGCSNPACKHKGEKTSLSAEINSTQINVTTPTPEKP